MIFSLCFWLMWTIILKLNLLIIIIFIFFNMVTNEQISFYRRQVSLLLMELRSLLFIQSGRTSYPTDTSIAFRLGISPTALSSISRQCSSMSGITLSRLLREIALLSAPGDFDMTMQRFFTVN